MSQYMMNGGSGQAMQVIRIGDETFRIAVKNEGQPSSYSSNNGGQSVNRRKAAMRVPSHRRSYGVRDDGESTACEAEFREATSYEQADYDNMVGERGGEGELEEDEEHELMRQLNDARVAKPYMHSSNVQTTSLRNLPYTDSTETASEGYDSHHAAESEHIPEGVTMKRQYRLYKNREAAKECRRKKKDYVHCLENRVVVLENQNKTLIAELKTLKQLYCRSE